MERTIETFENVLAMSSIRSKALMTCAIKKCVVRLPTLPNPIRRFKLLDLKAQRNYNTTIVITMINLNKPWQADEFERLKEAFSMDVYVYLKSQDQMWYDTQQVTQPSIGWNFVVSGHP